MKPPERFCTICNAKGQQVVATHVAASATGLEWYECGAHEPGDHDAEFGFGEQRVGLVLLVDWFRRIPGFDSP